MSELYPLKFEPILKDKIWGGHILANQYGKNEAGLKNIGESWELSAMADDLSVVSNGFLAGNNIEEIIEVYMGDIVGDAIFEKFGNEFPLLIKLIEAKEDLSVQVHPGNEQAKRLHNAYGKTEMWYILQSEKDARIYTGFSKPLTREEYITSLKNDKILDLLNVEIAEPGDTFFTPAGRIHAIGAGIVLAEIQQTSDITYRIYDWGRKNKDGSSRELHTEYALEAIDYSLAGKIKIGKKLTDNITENLVSNQFFITNILHFDEPVEKDYSLLDSFVIYLCTEGRFIIRYDDNSEAVVRGETVLLPAMINDVVLVPEPEATILEIYIKTENSSEI
jgi:mannose-6-phosphate isomerase